MKDESKVLDLLIGEKKDKIQQLEKLEKSGVSVLKVIINHYNQLSEALLEIDSILGGELENIKSPEDLESIIERVKEVKNPTPISNSDMSKKLDELQETLRRINNSL